MSYPSSRHGDGVKRQHPDGGYAEFLQVIELLCEAREIAHAVVAAVIEGADMHSNGGISQ
jgi:hypothetical protein